MEKLCKFDLAWRGICGKSTVEESDYCEKHSVVKCQVCGEQATRECSYTGQFVCGVPLCDNCEGWEDITKPSGSWGFLNHKHRRKEGEER